MPTPSPSCKERVNSAYKSRIGSIRKLWELYSKDSEAEDAELGNFSEYGLCFDYVIKSALAGRARNFVFSVTKDSIPIKLNFGILTGSTAQVKSCAGATLISCKKFLQISEIAAQYIPSIEKH